MWNGLSETSIHPNKNPSSYCKLKTTIETTTFKMMLKPILTATTIIIVTLSPNLKSLILRRRRQAFEIKEPSIPK